MINSVERIDWRAKLKVWGWYSEIQKMIERGDFRIARSGYINGISEEVGTLVNELESTCYSHKGMGRLVAYLNFKGDDIVDLPHDGSNIYWLRINNLVINFELKDEYEGAGHISFGLQVNYIDKAGTDEEWKTIFSELLKAANGDLEGVNGFYSDEYLD